MKKIPPRRRVGTLTLGLTLVTAGVLMALFIFCPALDLSRALKGSPAILVSLGIEVLLACRKGGRIQYDWAGCSCASC